MLGQGYREFDDKDPASGSNRLLVRYVLLAAWLTPFLLLFGCIAYNVYANWILNELINQQRPVQLHALIATTRWGTIRVDDADSMAYLHRSLSGATQRNWPPSGYPINSMALDASGSWGFSARCRFPVYLVDRGLVFGIDDNKHNEDMMSWYVVRIDESAPPGLRFLWTCFFESEYLPAASKGTHPKLFDASSLPDVYFDSPPTGGTNRSKPWMSWKPFAAILAMFVAGWLALLGIGHAERHGGAQRMRDLVAGEPRLTLAGVDFYQRHLLVNFHCRDLPSLDYLQKMMVASRSHWPIWDRPFASLQVTYLVRKDTILEARHVDSAYVLLDGSALLLGVRSKPDSLDTLDYYRVPIDERTPAALRDLVERIVQVTSTPDGPSTLPNAGFPGGNAATSH